MCPWLLLSLGGEGGEGKGDLSCLAYPELRGCCGMAQQKWIGSPQGVHGMRSRLWTKGRGASAKEESLVAMKIEQAEVIENQSTVASEPKTVFMEQEEEY